jgi:hypothetical protein
MLMFRMFRLHPPHGWNAVGWELAIVTIGVLLALGAQEFVQALHWRSEIKETRTALDAELSRDLAAFDYRLNESPCIIARAAELQKWAQSFRSGKPLQLKHPIINPPGFAIRTEVWDLIDGDIASRIPLKDRLNYSGLYSGMKGFSDVEKEEGQAWETIMEYQDSSALTDADIRKISVAAGGLAAASTNFSSWNTTMSRQARELRLSPDPMLLKTANPLIEKSRREACEPYL